MATREDMLARIEAGYRQTAEFTGRLAPSPPVLAAMRSVPREAFVRSVDRADAYENHPLPIGHRQTISQPYIVALMADLCDLTDGARVLEIGTGSGYAAAVLAELAGTVFTIENIEPLAECAAARLADLGYKTIHVHCGDGSRGWPEEAPFDAIVVSAAAETVPQALLDQLAAPGVLVVPVGPEGQEQQLVRFVKASDGQITEEAILPVAFVPLVPDEPQD